ncbi:LacI family DNA-binding transcriptional regulator [Cellulomonas composti]|nr:LacI family DNA-binding transcriptional regulator [Cellulomonas composti]
MGHGIEDVARAAGVSTATVSRALRGLPHVTDATRERVRLAALELGYVATPSARSLATGRTRTIGLLLPWVSHWFFANVVEGAERTLREHDHDALLYTFDVFERGPRRRVETHVLRGRVDGILVVGLPLEPEEIVDLDALVRPLVFVGSGPGDRCTIRVDEQEVSRIAVDHLIGLGHRRIGHVTGHPDDVSPWSAGVLRTRAWRDVMGATGLTADALAYGNFDVGGGRAAAHELLTRHPDVTSVFVTSDEMAMGVIAAARDRGLRVPEDLSVIGVDGHELGEVVALTTVAQDVHAQGVLAARLVLAQIAGEEVPQRVTPQVRLVLRGSTAPPRDR